MDLNLGLVWYFDEFVEVDGIQCYDGLLEFVEVDEFAYFGWVWDLDFLFGLSTVKMYCGGG